MPRVRAAEPVLVMRSDAGVALVPMVLEPKSSEDGATVTAGSGTAVPTPVSGTVSGEEAASEPTQVEQLLRPRLPRRLE